MRFKKWMAYLLIITLVTFNPGFTFAESAVSSTTWAGTVYPDGTLDTNWHTEANWIGGLPQSQADVIIPDTAASPVLTIDGASLTGGTAAVYNFTATYTSVGLTINLVNNPTIEVNRDFVAANVNFTGSGTILVGARGSSPYAGTATLTNVTLASGITLDASGGITMVNTTAGTVVSGGDLNMTGSSVNSATVAGAAILDQSTITYRAYNIGGDLTMTNTSQMGIVDRVGGNASVTASDIDALYQVIGALEVKTNGEVTMSSTGAIGGSVTLSENALLNGRITGIGSDVSIDHSTLQYDAAPDYSATIGGNVSIVGGTFTNNLAYITLNGDLALSIGAKLENKRTLNITGTTTVDGTSEYKNSSATATFGGAASIDVGGVFALTGYNYLTFQNGIANLGSISFDQTTRITASNGTLKLNNATAMDVDYLNTTDVKLLDTKLSSIRSDAAGFTHTGTLTLTNSTLDTTRLRLSQITMNTHTVTVDGSSIYTFEALGKFSDGTGTKLNTITGGTNLYVTIEDMNRNLTNTPDTVTLIVTSETGDSETLTLTETDNSTGVFRNTVALPVVIAAGNASGNNTLGISATDENITGAYTDGSEQLTIKMFKPYVVWDGAVSNDWYDTGNWVEGRVPNATDNVRITGSRGPSVYNSLEVLAFEAALGFTGGIQLYGNATALESIKILGGNFDVSSRLNVTGDLTIKDATNVNIYGANGSTIGGNVDVDGISTNFYLQASNARMTVAGTTTIKNVLGTAHASYITFNGDVVSTLNNSAQFYYDIANETVQITNNDQVRTNDSTFKKSVTISDNRMTNHDYDDYQMDLTVTNAEDVSMYDLSVAGTFTTTGLETLGIDYSDFGVVSISADDINFYNNDFSAATTVNGLNSLSTGSNDFHLAPVTLSALDFTLNGSDQFYGDATITGTNSLYFYGNTNTSGGHENETIFRNGTVTFVGTITSEPSVALRLYDAQLIFPLNTVFPEMISLWSDGDSSVKNATITLPRDEYVDFSNQGTLTLDNTIIHGTALMTNDVTQTGAIIKANGGDYHTQGQGYFGDENGLQSANVSGDLWFYLVDHDQNLSATKQTVDVQLADAGGVIRTLTLTETENSSGIFSSVIASGDVSDTLKVTYDGRIIQYKRPNMTWTGSGSTDNWYEAANWNEGIVPLEFDSVLIDQTADNILMNEITTVRNLALGANYTGKLTRTEGTLSTLDFTVTNGIFELSESRNHPVNILGNLTANGGDITKIYSAYWTVDGDVVVTDSSDVDLYQLRANSDVTVTNSTLKVPYYFEVYGKLTVDGVMNAGTLRVYNTGEMVVENGTLQLSTLDNDATLHVKNGKISTTYHYQDGNMTLSAGEMTVASNASFTSGSTFTLSSGKYLLTSWGNTGSFGKIIQDGGLFDAYGYGSYQGDITINSGKMRINSKGANDSYFNGDITIGDYGNLAFGSNASWSRYNFSKAFRSSGTYSFGNQTYLVLNSGADIDLQGKTLEVFSLNIPWGAQAKVQNGTIKIQNRVNSVFYGNGNSVLTLVNATIDAVNAYQYTFSGRTVLDETSRFARKSTGLNIVDQNGNVAPHLFTFGNTLYVLVEDQGANQNSGVAETVTLQYKNLTSGEIENITLTEENTNSKRFRGSISSTAIDFGTPAGDDGVAEGSNGRGTNKILNFKDQLILKYVDTRTELGLDIFEVAYNGAKLALGSSEVEISSTGIDFGISYVDEYAVDQVMLYNRGDVTLEITEASILNDPEHNFKFAGNGDASVLAGGTIKVAPKSQVALGLVFEASTPGVKTGTIKLKSNDIETPELTLSLTGTAGYRPTVVEPKVTAASYAGTTSEAGQLGVQTVNLSEFFAGRNNLDPLSIRISGNSNTSLFEQFSFNPATNILTYKIAETAGVSPEGMATIAVEATDTLGFKAETAFGVHVYRSNNAELLNLKLLDVDDALVGTWDETFDAETLSYQISVPVEISAAKIVATPVNPNTDITVSNTDAQTGITNLSFGNNTRTVTVVSEDSTTTKVYTLVINRPNATLTGTGPSSLVFEAGKALNNIAIDESLRVNGAEKVEVKFTGGYVTSQDKLLYTVPSGSPVTATYDQALGKLILTGSASATAADYNDILKTVRYENSGSPATAGNRTVQFALYFGSPTVPVTTLSKVISVNNAPVVKDQTFVHVIEGGSLVKTLNAVDADGDTLTFELVTAPLKEADGLIAINGLSFTYAPKNGETGLDSFVYRVTDGKSYSDYATITVNLVNQGNEGLPPLVIQEQVEAESYRENLIDAFSTGTLTADVSKFFDGQNNDDPLSYKLVFNSNEDLFESTSFDPETGIFTYVIKKGASTANKGQALITFEAMDSVGYVAEATMVVDITDAIAITYKVGDHQDSVTGNVILPSTAPGVDAVTWTSNRPDIISNSGAVTRPVKDTIVKLTAQIETNGFYKWKDFYLTVKGTSALDKAADRLSTNIGYATGEDINTVKNNLFLTKVGSTGCQVSWSSSAPLVISNTGRVTRPGPEDVDATVTLTATITDPDNLPAVTQTFVVTVKKLTDKEAAEEAARKMTISDAATFAVGDIWESVTEAFLLLETGAHNTQITWSSSDDQVVELTDEGGQTRATVTRSEKDKNILLTATFTKGAETAVKSFLVIIKADGVTKDPNDVRVDSTRTATLTQVQDGVDTAGNTVIYRTELSNGKIIDTIIIDESQLQTLVDIINPEDPVLENRTVTVVMESPLNDEPDEIAVELQADALYAVSNRNAQLEIKTPIADIMLDQASLKQVADEGTDLYFRIRPITDDTEKNGMKLSVVSDAAVRSALPSGKAAEAISTPLKIETNLDAVTTEIRIPLSEIASSIPLDSVAVRDAFLQSLAIYVQHSDGENKVYTPTVIYNADGDPVALSFIINKFSAFQIFKTVAAAPSSSGSDLPVTVKSVLGSKTVPFSEVETAVNEGKPIIVTVSGITVEIPFDAFDVAALKGQPLVITIASVDTDTQSAFAKAATAQGAKLMSTAYQITMNLTQFSKPYRITVSDELGKITTGVLYLNQKLYHQPTVVEVVNSQYRGSIFTFETGVFGFIYKELSFKDIWSHWSRSTVENQAGRLVVLGENSLFAPNRAIDRAEFITLMIRSLGFAPKSTTVAFSDIKGSEWYIESVNTALSLNLALGYGDGTFKPDRLISREEAMTMVSRAMKLLTYENTLTEAEALSKFNLFPDHDQVSTWAKAFVLDQVSKQTIEGKSGLLVPKASITRAEAIQLLQNMLKQAHIID